MGQTEVITQLERSHMKAQRRHTVVILEDLDFVWDEEEIAEFKEMWASERPFDEIVEWFGRDPDEVGLLVMDLARKGDIKPRERGIH